VDWSDGTEEHAFRGEVRRVIEQRLPAFYRGRKSGPAGVSPQYWWQWDVLHGGEQARSAALDWADALGERGWGAPHWPTEYGGAGLTPIEQFILNQELAAAEAPIVGGPGVKMLGPTIMLHGTEEQKRRFLPPTLAGEMVWAQGYSEPGAGSDLASLATRAVRDGDDYVITGQKIWTSLGHVANWIFLLVRTAPEAPKHRGISFVLLPLDSAGVEVRPIISAAWERRTNESFYDGVRVPVVNRIGEENRGWYVAMTLLDHERSNVGGAVAQRREIERLIDYLGSPEGRGRSRLARLGAIRQLLATRYLETEVLANLSFRIISIQKAGRVPNYEASISKIVGSALAQELQQSAMKAFGLYANLWPGSPYAPLDGRHTYHSIDYISATIAGGSNEIQRNVIATRGLGLPRG
jgi:alkylation response protein AidB-like acyl-CoA dehydrogenase